MREDAARRLGVLSLYTAALVVGVEVFQALAQPELARVLADPLTRLTTLAAVVLAVGVSVTQRFRLVVPATTLMLGMIFEIAVAFAIAMVETSVPFTPGKAVLGISSIGPWLVFVSVVIPQRPGVTLAVTMIAATTWPVAYAINAARFDFPTPPIGQWLTWPVINYLMAFLSFIAGNRAFGTACRAQQAEDLGSYRLVSLIGEGGMGEVWKATHHMLAREAAVKLVRPEMIADSSARQADTAVRRFRREANAIASLQSPHTVYLYDFGVSQEGQLYYVMELLDGISLQTLVTHFGPQPPSRTAALLRQVCHSLHEAHSRGLVHRDLKPSNVMICEVALEYDFVKVLDFGLAKSIERADVTQLTVEGLATGTPGYMAPEVATGETRIDGRADLYALGCIAYFLLTGTMVFRDSSAVNMALKHVQAIPDPPSQRTELPIPPDLERVVLQCLAKKPADRPASARELAEMIEACNVPAWTPEQARAWWERHLPPTSSLRSFAQPGIEATPAAVRKV
jgi:serine/threonine-protein kinase